MKTLQLLALCLFLNVTGNLTAQVYTFKSSSLSIMEKDDKGKWGKWSDFKKAELIITLDGKKDRIVVNSRDILLFNILSYGKVVENDTDKTVPFECLDNNGEKCSLMIITRKKQGNRMQLYINYKDLKMVYNMEQINQ